MRARKTLPLLPILAALLTMTASGRALAAPSPRGALDDVVTVAADDAWAVGPRVLLHRDATSWTVTPWRTTLSPRYAAVAATSADDVWAVGRVTRYDQWRPLVLHWNGMRWTHQRVPSFRGEVSLTDVIAQGPTEAWAVGFRTVYPIEGPTDGLLRAVALRWDGARWTRVDAPADIRFDAAVRIGGAQLWVAGRTADDSPVVLRRRADGSWRTYPVPVPTGSACHLADIARSTLVGWCTDTLGRSEPYAARFDLGGLTLQTVGGRGKLHAVDATTQVFAVGADLDRHAAVWRAGKAPDTWWKAAFPFPSRGTSGLLGVSIGSSGDGWAVGWRSAAGGGIRPLSAYWDGHGWSLVRV